jgi:hypothetical protein
LRIEVAGLTPGEHDLPAVNGHASLAGSLQLIGVGSFKLHVGDQVTFLTANGENPDTMSLFIFTRTGAIGMKNQLGV